MMGGESDVEASYASRARVAWMDRVENPAVSDISLRGSLHSSLFSQSNECFDFSKRLLDVAHGDGEFKSVLNRERK